MGDRWIEETNEMIGGCWIEKKKSWKFGGDPKNKKP